LLYALPFVNLIFGEEIRIGRLNAGMKRPGNLTTETDRRKGCGCYGEGFLEPLTK
jgi:hypothetical protein